MFKFLHQKLLPPGAANRRPSEGTPSENTPSDSIPAPRGLLPPPLEKNKRWLSKCI